MHDPRYARSKLRVGMGLDAERKLHVQAAEIASRLLNATFSSSVAYWSELTKLAEAYEDASEAAMDMEDLCDWLLDQLRFYASPVAYEESAPLPGCIDGHFPIWADKGGRAQRALDHADRMRTGRPIWRQNYECFDGVKCSAPDRSECDKKCRRLKEK